ncbi:MAG: creatininase family protein [Candidatus Aminicenantes bacterium]|jgi:creatinine amidohydrolase
MMRTIRMEDMNSSDIKEAIDNGFTTAVFAIGSTEQHGRHLPTKTDAMIGDALAFRVAQELGNALQAPTIRPGCSEHHMAFAGTISLRQSTLKSIIDDYVSSLEKGGFQTIILLPSHGGNFTTVEKAIDELKPKHPGLQIIGYTDLHGFMTALNTYSKEHDVTPEESGAHAGESETSIILALAENLVEKERFAPGYLGPLGDKEIKIILEQGMPSLTENGVLGDPTKASAKKGMVYLEKTVNFLVEEIKKQLEP